MYITNPQILPKEKLYKCSKQISKWLQYEHNIPLLGNEGEYFYFAKTDELEQALLRLPFWLKLYAYS